MKIHGCCWITEARSKGASPGRLPRRDDSWANHERLIERINNWDLIRQRAEKVVWGKGQ